jgi:hypothetical protein
VKLPYGDFIIESQGSGPLILVAGGTGITPFVSFLASTGASASVPVRVLYGVRRSDLLIYRAVLEEAAKRFRDLRWQAFVEENAGAASGPAGSRSRPRWVRHATLAHPVRRPFTCPGRRKCFVCSRRAWRSRRGASPGARRRLGLTGGRAPATVRANSDENVILCGGLGTRLREETDFQTQAHGRGRRPAHSVAHHEDLRPLRLPRVRAVPGLPRRP